MSATNLPPAPIASSRHTAGLVTMILAFAVTGRVLVGNQEAATLEDFGRVRIYLVALASMWALAAYVVWCISGGRKALRKLMDESAWNGRRIGGYLLMAVGMMMAWGACSWLLGLFLRPPPGSLRNLRVLLPNDGAEKLLWILLSVSAGFCEELVYRGYLLRQFWWLTGHRMAGVILQAFFYGAAHAALPWQVGVSVGCLGLLFGGVATWRRTLVPGMFMHAVFDLAAVFARR